MKPMAVVRSLMMSLPPEQVFDLIDNDEAEVLKGLVTGNPGWDHAIVQGPRDEMQRTPLIRAVQQGSAGCIHVLRQGGADPYSKDLKGRTAAGAALAHHEDTQILKALADTGWRPETELKQIETASKTTGTAHYLHGHFPFAAIGSWHDGRLSPVRGQIETALRHVQETCLGGRDDEKHLNPYVVSMDWITVTAWAADSIALEEISRKELGKGCEFERFLATAIQINMQNAPSYTFINTALQNGGSLMTKPHGFPDRPMHELLQSWPRSDLSAALIYFGTKTTDLWKIDELGRNSLEALIEHYRDEIKKDSPENAVDLRNRIEVLIAFDMNLGSELPEGCHMFQAARVPDGGKLIRAMARQGYHPGKLSHGAQRTLGMNAISSRTPGNVETLFELGIDLWEHTFVIGGTEEPSPGTPFDYTDEIARQSGPQAVAGVKEVLQRWYEATYATAPAANEARLHDDTTVASPGLGGRF